MALSFFSSGRICEKAMREASSMAYMDELPADATVVALSPAVAGDAVADPVETAELLDVDVDELAGVLALIAAHRLGRLQCADAVQAKAPEDAADGGRRDAEFSRDLLAGPALPPQPLHFGDERLRGRAAQPVRPRRAVLQALRPFVAEPLNPFAHRAHRHAERLRRRRLAAALPATRRTRSARLCGVRRAFLCMFIRLSPEVLKLRNLSILGRSRMDNLLKAHS